MGVLNRSARGFSADNLTDRAAALTYYGVLAIFPTILALGLDPRFDWTFRDATIDPEPRTRWRLARPRRIFSNAIQELGAQPWVRQE